MAISCIKEYGICDEHTDSIALVISSIDGTERIHGFGGAPQAAAVGTNFHHVWNKDGSLFTRYAAPFPADSEMLVSLVKSGKIVAMGSINSQEVWEFDYSIAGYTSASWSKIGTTYTAAIGVRAMAAYCDLGGWFYVVGGWGGTNVVRTQDFVTWSTVVALPSAIDRISGCGFAVHGGVLHLIGGATRIASPYDINAFYAAEQLGHHYTFNGTSFSLVETDATKFGHIWGDLASDGTNLWYSRGFRTVGGNERGLLKSTDEGSTFTTFSPLNDGMRWFVESHRRGALSTSGGAYFIGGNFVNDMWKMT